MKKIPILAFCFSFAGSAFAQTLPNIPYQSLLQMNPSFAGSNGGVRVQTFTDLSTYFRVRGTGFYKIANAFDCYLPSIKSAIGMSMNYENDYNILRNSSANLIYARYFKVGEKLKIIPSVQGGYARREINQSWLYYSNGLSGTGWESSNTYSFGYGLLVNYKNFYGGFNAVNVNYPAFIPFNSRRQFVTIYQLHASYNLNLTENFRVNLCGQYLSQSAYSRGLISANILFYKHFLLGFTREGNQEGFNAGIRMDYFTVQFSAGQYMGTDKDLDYYQIILSFNLRNKALRHTLTNFEAW